MKYSKSKGLETHKTRNDLISIAVIYLAVIMVAYLGLMYMDRSINSHLTAAEITQQVKTPKWCNCTISQEDIKEGLLNGGLKLDLMVTTSKAMQPFGQVPEDTLTEAQAVQNTEYVQMTRHGLFLQGNVQQLQGNTEQVQGSVE